MLSTASNSIEHSRWLLTLKHGREAAVSYLREYCSDRLELYMLKLRIDLIDHILGITCVCANLRRHESAHSDTGFLDLSVDKKM